MVRWVPDSPWVGQRSSLLSSWGEGEQQAVTLLRSVFHSMPTPHCSPIPLGSPRSAAGGEWSRELGDLCVWGRRCHHSLRVPWREAQTRTLSLELGRVPLVCGLAPGASR